MTDQSRCLVQLVRITLPWCGNAFGVAPCAAAGNPAGVPCWNTYHTCSDRANYAATTRSYLFSSAAAPLPFPGPRPYVRSISYLPTEIIDNMTRTGRIKIEFADEPDSDIGIDPYVTGRAAWPEIPGTFFRKLLARNPNYKGATCEIYEGVLGQDEADYVKTAHVLLETGAVGSGKFTFESVDLLAGLGEITLPKKVSLSLLGDLLTAGTSTTLADTADADALATAAGYVRIDDEIIGYSSYDQASHVLSGLTRGAFGTAAADHSASTAVQPCRYFAPGNPFDHLLAMLSADAGYDPALIDSGAFAATKAWPGDEIDMSALFSVPTKLNDIYMGLVDQLDCRSWVAENLQISIARNIANQPGRSYTALSDAGSIIKGSASTDLLETSRKTRCVLYWERSASGDPAKPESYSRIDVGVNAEAETEYGDIAQETLYSPWLTAAGIPEETLAAYLSDTLLRRMFRSRDAAAVITASVDPKDGALQVGDFVTLSTDELCNPDGTPLTARCQVIRRDYKGTKVEYKFQRLQARRGAFFGPDDDSLTYDTATEAQREYGGFYANDANFNSDGTPGAIYY